VSTTKRIISGSAASWVRIGITMLAQLLLVPVYLKYWSIEVYGIWIAIQALVSILSTLDQGHQTFLEFEFLRFGRDKPKEIALTLWSSLSIALFIGLIEIGIVLFFIFCGNLKGLLGLKVASEAGLMRDAGYVLLMLMTVWAFVSNIGGIFVRVLSPFGYYARMNWWGVFSTVVASIVPVIAVAFGAGLFEAGVVMAAASVLYSIPQYFDIYRLMKKEKIGYQGTSFKHGTSNFILSLALSGKGLLENARQQGVRVILAPLAGASGLVAFSTMRTGANIALQGLNTITNPLMPEIMRFLNQKDQEKMESSFGVVWAVVIFFLTPSVMLLQVFIGPLFKIWTQSQVEFDPLLFALLSLGVLVFAVAQPAISIVRGNNLLKPQVIIASIAAVLVVGGMFVLVPVKGILGAGISLLAGEIVAAFCYRFVARQWLHKQGMAWPVRSSRIAIAAVCVAAFAMLAMYFVPGYNWLFLAAGLLVLVYLMKQYLHALPPIAVSKLQDMSRKVGILNRLIVYGKKR